MERKRKLELREINARAWAGDKEVFDVHHSLDSSLKKNTAFIKRLRTGISSTALNGFLAEIGTLSLHKYIPEIISAATEGLAKLKTTTEIFAGVEIVSALHQRFGPAEFTKQLGWLLGRSFAGPDKGQLKNWTQELRDREEKERLQRHRLLLRIVTELWLVGVLKSLDDTERPEDAPAKKKEAASSNSANKGEEIANHMKRSTSTKTFDEEQDGSSEPFPLEVLKELLGHDRDHSNVSLAVMFVKNFSGDIFGISEHKETSEQPIENDGGHSSPVRESLDTNLNSGDIPDISYAHNPSLVSEKMLTRFRNVLVRYLESLKSHLIRDQKALNNQSRRNAEAYVKSGEVFEDRQANFEKQTKNQEKLVANAQSLCDYLRVEMPNLSEQETTNPGAMGGIGLIKTGDYLSGQGEGSGIWEDEDERRFYENLIDLRGRVPAVLLEDGVKKKTSATDEAASKGPAPKDEGSVDPEISGDYVDSGPGTVSTNENQEATTTTSSSPANRSMGVQVDILLSKLPELHTKDAVDQMALEFCFLNSKASRNRLIKALSEVPKGRSDLLPFYARLVATLGQYLPDVTHGLIAYLDEEFRSLQRRKSKDFLGQIRMLNIRYLAQLTKFGVVPDHIIFHCFKVCLEDLSRMNVEIIAHLLENCGRYLLRNSSTSPRMSSFLETLNRKKSAHHLGQQERMLIENAMYHVDPPERAAIQQKERTPMDLFIRQLIYLDMNKRNYSKVLKSVRKLHWEESEVVMLLERVFSKPGKVKYSNIHLLAALASALYRYHPDFVVGVIDNVLEGVTLGLEQNDFKFNQRRMAEVKYLGELYNYKLVDSSVIFDTMYRVVAFGYEGGLPSPSQPNPLDQPDDFFRVRLVGTLLETCGVCFDRGHTRKKLDFFLTFFQYYLRIKGPLPMDIDFIVQDVFALVRPQWKIAADLAEATHMFSEAVALNYKTDHAPKMAELENDAEAAMSDEEDGERENSDDADRMDSSPEEMEATEENEQRQVVSDPEGEEQIYVTRQEEQLDPEFEAEFDQAFDKMMAESLESRKFERKGLFDMPLPMRRGNRDTVVSGGDVSVADADGQKQQQHLPPSSTMSFALMTKKGNRQQTRTLDLPSDSHFAVAMRSQQQAQREEQQRIKNLVLNYDMSNDVDIQDGSSERHNAQSSHIPYARADRPGVIKQRNAPRARKLQLSDVDWYGLSSPFSRVPGSRHGPRRGRGRG